MSHATSSTCGPGAHCAGDGRPCSVDTICSRSSSVSNSSGGSGGSGGGGSSGGSCYSGRGFGAQRGHPSDLSVAELASVMIDIAIDGGSAAEAALVAAAAILHVEKTDARAQKAAVEACKAARAQAEAEEQAKKEAAEAASRAANANVRASLMKALGRR